NLHCSSGPHFNLDIGLPCQSLDFRTNHSNLKCSHESHAIFVTEQRKDYNCDKLSDFHIDIGLQTESFIRAN
ncbi:MAG: hypothetical protein ACRD42_03965, partial [Nitrososphaeraceae archaeon]